MVNVMLEVCTRAANINTVLSCSVSVRTGAVYGVIVQNMSHAQEQCFSQQMSKHFYKAYDHLIGHVGRFKVSDVISQPPQFRGRIVVLIHDCVSIMSNVPLLTSSCVSTL